MTAEMSQPSEPDETKTGAERRRWERANADWPITLDLADGVCQGRLRDLSRGGVCFFIDRAIPMMTLLKLELQIPVDGGVRNVIGKGAVVRCEKISARLDHYEVAVFLQDVAQPDREAIEAFVVAKEQGR